MAKKEDKALYFSSDYTGEIKPVDLETISQTEKLHITKTQFLTYASLPPLCVSRIAHTFRLSFCYDLPYILD